MKKVYITTLPINLSDVKTIRLVDGKKEVISLGRCMGKYNYIAQAGCRINNDLETGFPILKVMKDTVDEDDYKIIAVKSESSESDAVYQYFCDEIRENGYALDKIELIKLEEIQSNEVMNELFYELFEKIGDDCEVYASVEYGTKIISITNIYALQISQRLRKNISIEGVYYGELVREAGNIVASAKLYDVSSIFYLNELISQINIDNITNAEEFVKTMLHLDEII